MKTALLVVLLLSIPAVSTAQDAPSPREITTQVVKTATAYANAISCQGNEIGPEDVVSISPYTSIEDRPEAEYVVIWRGDIDCLGGNATTTTNLTSIKIGIGDSYVVDLARSSPAIQFDAGLEASLVGSAKDTLIFEKYEYVEGDANCCPSIKKRITLRADQQGNWKQL